VACEKADSTLKATLEDEKNNVDRLKVLKKESECLHTLVCEQIKWCKVLLYHDSY
jgi:hypothetical protein